MWLTIYTFQKRTVRPSQTGPDWVVADPSKSEETLLLAMLALESQTKVGSKLEARALFLSRSKA